MMLNEMKLRMPIGVDDFAKLRTNHFYYVDKTGMIKELLENWGEVNLFTRPRRFGKSINMSMLRYFFEIGTDKSLFDGLQILKETELCEKYMGQYPVISLTLKDVRGKDFSTAIAQMWSAVSMEANRLNMIYDLQNSDQLDPADKELLIRLRTEQGKPENSISILSYLLYKHCGKKSIVLLDEYDVPLQKAEAEGYYKDIVGFISTFFSSGLKSNEYILFAVVTGCLRIAKESIFTGFNNPKMHTLVDEPYDEWFGFTDQEVREMLENCGKGDFFDITKEWYDGYLFGNIHVYCPWDVINWCNQLMNTSNQVPQNFWENTSGNEMVIRFAEVADSDTRDEIGLLMEGKTVKKNIRFDITYDELDANVDNLWSVLFSTGYLTQCGRDPEGRYELVIPNNEVAEIFRKKVDQWFREKVWNDSDGLKDFFQALDEEDEVAIEDCLIACMADTISYQDGGTLKDKENFYHGLLIGMLKNRSGWVVKSNREGGNGRPDLVCYPKKKRYAVIIEVKYSKKRTDLVTDAKEALEQIERLKYDEYFGSRGPDKIVHYGIAFYRKECRVLKG